MPSGLAPFPRHNDGMMSHTPQKFRFPLLATAAENPLYTSEPVETFRKALADGQSGLECALYRAVDWAVAWEDAIRKNKAYRPIYYESVLVKTAMDLDGDNLSFSWSVRCPQVAAILPRIHPMFGYSKIEKGVARGMIQDASGIWLGKDGGPFSIEPAYSDVESRASSQLMAAETLTQWYSAVVGHAPEFYAMHRGIPLEHKAIDALRRMADNFQRNLVPDLVRHTKLVERGTPRIQLRFSTGGPLLLIGNGPAKNMLAASPYLTLERRHGQYKITDVHFRDTESLVGRVQSLLSIHASLQENMCSESHLKELLEVQRVEEHALPSSVFETTWS